MQGRTSITVGILERREIVRLQTNQLPQFKVLKKMLKYIHQLGINNFDSSNTLLWDF
jgi:hypothetical protein